MYNQDWMNNQLVKTKPVTDFLTPAASNLFIKGARADSLEDVAKYYKNFFLNISHKFEYIDFEECHYNT